MDILDRTIYEAHEWARIRIDSLTKEDRNDDALCIAKEFNEWMDGKDEEHDIFSLEYIGDGSEFN